MSNTNVDAPFFGHGKPNSDNSFGVCTARDAANRGGRRFAIIAD
jgi:hypothetical protein